MTNLAGDDAWMKLSLLLAIPAATGPDDPAFVKWRQDCLRTLVRIEGEGSLSLTEFNEIDFRGNRLRVSVSEEDFQKYFRKCLSAAEAILKSLHDDISDEIGRKSRRATTEDENRPSKGAASPASRKVFVVHGHDENLKSQVARVLEQLELKPIILHEQPDRGQTIIEKFEKHSDVSFAVVLLTPDDVGGPAIGDSPRKPRARQNVIFEFGYFLGRLGRSFVCGLHRGDIELPSDYSGVLYTKVDTDGAWRFKLLKELKAAGFAVDANRLA